MIYLLIRQKENRKCPEYVTEGKVTKMERENNKMISTSEAAEMLKVKPSTIHRYVKEGKLKPVYEENWQIDTTKMFFKKDIESLKDELAKPGITTGEAAELLGVHPTTITLYINQGELKAEKMKYRGREIYFISPTELERFKSEYIETKKRERKEYYDKDTGYAWFQSFIDRDGNTNNRILLDDESKPYLSTADGRQISYNEIEKKGYEPIYPITDIPYKSKRGFAKFIFEENEQFYKIIELFYKYLGPKNMKVNLNNQGNIIVEVKPVLIPEILPEEIVEGIFCSVNQGDVIKRFDGIYIHSDLEILSVAAPSELKQKIKEDADSRKMNIEDLVIEILNNHYEIN